MNVWKFFLDIYVELKLQLKEVQNIFGAVKDVMDYG